MKPRGDKDFLISNKVALKLKATTSRAQYAFRQHSDIRMTHARPGTQMGLSTTKAAYRGNVSGYRPMSAAFRNQGHTMRENQPFGMPNRPSTPMKAVLGDFYGAVGAYHHEQRE